MQCYRCDREYEPDPKKVLAWGRSGRDFEPTDWECPTCDAFDDLDEEDASHLAAITSWVHAVNEQARLIDEKMRDLADTGIHPSAWAELLKPEVEKYKALAARGPEVNRDRQPG